MNGGIVAQKGFYIQGIATLLDILTRRKDEWDEVEAEIESDNDKVDYGFYKNGKLHIVAQVKSTQNCFTKKDIDQWLKDLYSDKPDVDEYVLVLAGNISRDTRVYINEINNDGFKVGSFGSKQKVYIDLKTNIIDELNRIYCSSLYEFMYKNNAGKKTIPWNILNDVAVILEKKFETLVLSQKRWNRTEIVEFLSEKIEQFIQEVENKLTPLSVVTFGKNSEDSLNETAEDQCLDLRNMFEGGRLLKDEYNWNDLIQKINEFVGNLSTKPFYKLNIEAGYTVAFALGRMMDGKSGLKIHLMQKSIGKGACVLDISSPPVTMANNSKCIIEEFGYHSSIAVAIGYTREIQEDVKRYISAEEIDVGKLLYVYPEEGPNQYSVRDADHAKVLAQCMLNEIQRYNADKILLFPACPAALCFMLGQLSRPLGNITVYEFDFDKRSGKTYYPTHTF